jgi:hypothetical protein
MALKSFSSKGSLFRTLIVRLVGDVVLEFSRPSRGLLSPVLFPVDIRRLWGTSLLCGGTRSGDINMQSSALIV